MAQQSSVGPWPPAKVCRHVVFYGDKLSAPRPILNLENQVFVFMTPEDWVAQIYP